jgi:hypothetical protein
MGDNMNRSMIALALGLLVLNVASCRSGTETDRRGLDSGTSNGLNDAGQSSATGATTSGTSSGPIDAGESSATGATTDLGDAGVQSTSNAPDLGSFVGPDVALLSPDTNSSQPDTMPSCSGTAGEGTSACGLLVTTTGPSYLWHVPILEANLSADVMVKSVGLAADPSDCSGQLLTLAAADGRTWTMELNVTDLPKDFIRVGDKLGLTVASWAGANSSMGHDISQSLVITWDGKTILVTWRQSLNAMQGPPGPASLGGITLASAEKLCETAAGWGRYHRALVSVGSDSAKVAPGESVEIGGMHVVLEDFHEYIGGYDSWSQLRFAAFAL